MNEDLVVFLDLEYIHRVLGLTRPNVYDWKEVVQICAIIFDVQKGEEIEKMDVLVKPTVHVKDMKDDQWIYFTKLTGISKQSVMNGQSFASAFKSLVEFIGEKKVVIMLGDKQVLEYNTRICGIDCPDFEFIKLKPLLVEIDEETFKPLYSCDLHRVVGLEDEDIIPADEITEESEEKRNAHPHNSLFDTRSMAWFVHKVLTSPD